MSQNRDPRKDPRPGDVVRLIEFGPPSELTVTGSTGCGVRYQEHSTGKWAVLSGWRNLTLMAEVLHVA